MALVRSRLKSRHVLLLAGAGALSLTLAVAARPQRPADQSPSNDIPWLSFGGNADNARYFPSDQINKSNVSQLQVAWSYPHSDTVFNPIVARGTVYGRGRNGAIVALDAKTGREIWVHEDMNGMTSRGMNYWESADGSDRRLIFTMNDYLQEIDAATGKSITTFGTEGVVDLREGLGRDPETIGRVQSGTPGEIFEDLILIGSATGEAYLSPPGDLRAYDVITGEKVWQFHTIPHPGEFGYETWPPDAYTYIGGVNTWGELSIDTERGIAYFPIGSPTYDYYGADRPGANLFATSLVALDARTGTRLWHYQVVHHDLWDFDNNAAPQLTTIRHEGRDVDVVAMAGKTGFLYVFDRVTGEPIWPIEERPVARSAMPGEQSWPTQPFPTKPEPFGRQQYTVDDINPYGNVTGEARAEMRARLERANNVGLFTPIDFTETVHIPGSNGGALFGTTAAEPHTGVVYVINQDNPGMLRLLRSNERRGGPAPMPGQAVYQRECQTCHGPGRMGTDEAPALVDVGTRMDAAEIRTTVLNGYGRMDPFPHLSPTDLDQVILYLLSPPPGTGRGRAGGPGGRGGGPTLEFPAGPVVASGGVKTRPPFTGGRGPRAYPEGGPTSEQYVINAYGTIGTMIKPPYTTIVKYDLNEPAIKWRVGLGDDPELAALGITGTGMTQMRNSLVVTAGGLLFACGGDNKIRAYDTDTGHVLWEGSYAGTFRGGPSMYMLDGRQYLLVPAAGNQLQAGNQAPPSGHPDGPLGYVAFALPE